MAYLDFTMHKSDSFTHAVHLLPQLDSLLIELLKSLTPEEWEAQTVTKLWRVKDVVAHLLDGNIRVLSILRDNYYGEKASITNHDDLVVFLNGLNADWVKAMKRVSPEMLILLHECTGKLYCDYYASLDPMGWSPFSVGWAGEHESRNWTHIAREYTEKWLHQQQICDAIGRSALMTPEFFHPFIDIFMLGLPHTFRNTAAAVSTIVKVTVSGAMGGDWFLVKAIDGWALEKNVLQLPATEVVIPPDVAWKLFSKSLRPESIRDHVLIKGDETLGETVLTMVSVMA